MVDLPAVGTGTGGLAPVWFPAGRRLIRVEDWRTCLYLTLKIGLVATAGIVGIGTLIAWPLARWQVPGRTLIETVLLLPMTLPPVAVGLVLLKVMEPDGWLSRLFESMTGERLLLTWQAAAIAAFTVALPLYTQAARDAFAQVPRRYEQVPMTMGLSAGRIWLTVSLPLAAPGLISGALLAFARALGEFGATSLVAGAIQGRTETLALAIYNRILGGHDKEAWQLAGISAAVAGVAVLASQLLKVKFKRLY